MPDQPPQPQAEPLRLEEPTEDELLAVTEDELQEAAAALSGAMNDYDGSRIRVLMLEVLRRAAYDWVLYRNSRRLDQKTIAYDAYVWLFEEDEYHPWRIAREEEGTTIMSLESICDIMDFDIETVRDHVRRLTPDKIKTAGRPPERRKRQTEDTSYYNEHGVMGSFTFPSDEE